MGWEPAEGKEDKQTLPGSSRGITEVGKSVGCEPTEGFTVNRGQCTTARKRPLDLMTPPLKTLLGTVLVEWVEETRFL